MAALGSVADRRAIEALRSGVPNGDAVRALGCNQPQVETRFAELLEGVAEGDGVAQGLLIAGGFGSGKSHLLEYLQQMALAQNFVASRVVISKETPLYDPAKVFRAAVEAAHVPRRNGMAVHEIALSLRQDSKAYA
jgi:predicted NACHT family NTPase